MTPAAATVARGWRYHPERDALLAEAHARPSTPLATPMLATRVATLSGEAGAAADRAHMAALCRKLGQPEPGPSARWCVLDAGGWRLRWERHTEVSTWTFFRPARDEPLFAGTALDLAPLDWLSAWPGEVLAAARLEVRSAGDAVSPQDLFGPDAIGSRVADGAATVLTDFRPDVFGMTRFVLLDASGDESQVGRLAQYLLEIETYRLLALLAFPVAGQTAAALTQIETTAAELAEQVAQPAHPDADRRLLDRLAVLAGSTEALIGRTTYRFDAASAYHELVRQRIDRLGEQRIDRSLTLGEFMQRRLDPAMRTCDAVAERQRAAIGRIARMTELLSTRVEVAAEATNAAVLASMDRRAALQLRLQTTVEGLSAAAIAYYAVGLLTYPLKALEKLRPGLDATLVAGVLAPVVALFVWFVLRRLRKGLSHEEPGRSPP